MRRIPLGGLALLAGLAIPSAGRADGDLDKEMAAVAHQIKSFLDQEGKDAIVVGDFRGPARLAASAGPAITKALGDELRKLGVAVKRRADLEVNGDYRDVEDRTSKSLAVQIKARIVDRSGAEVVALEPRGVFNVATVAALTGITVAMPADATEEVRQGKLAEALDTPTVHLANTRIAAEPGSPYALEILVKAGGALRPRAASKDEDGFAFLHIRRDEIYAVRLINDSPHDAAVTLTIDGLSVFAFSENKGYTHYIVPKGKSATIPGWHRTNAVSDAFQVTAYARSVAAEKMPSSASVGTITASFAAAWPPGTDPPADEAGSKKGSRPGDATGKGPPVETRFTEVVREVGRMRVAVSVRYNKEADPRDLPPDHPEP